MRAGKLNKRVEIQHLADGQDEIGQPTQVWTALATVWANVRFLSGTQAIKADADTSISKASIRIRLRRDVTASMRAVLKGTVFQITAVLPDEEGGEFLDLVCEAVDA